MPIWHLCASQINASGLRLRFELWLSTSRFINFLLMYIFLADVLLFCWTSLKTPAAPGMAKDTGQVAKSDDHLLAL